MRGRLVFVMALAISSLQSAFPLEFEWAAPLPHRQDWFDMAAGNGRIVGITDGDGGRSVYTSKDGRNWIHPASAPKGRLRDIVFNDGIFMAIGEPGAIFTSANGEDWAVHLAGSIGTFGSIARGNGVTVATAYGGVVLVSADLQNWTQVEAFRRDTTAAVAFGNGRFIAIGAKSWTEPWSVWTSVDGVEWTAGGRPEGPLELGSVQYGGAVFSNGLFAMAVYNGSSQGVIVTSSDGILWKVASNSLFRVIPTAGGFFGITQQGVFKSNDASDWQRVFTYPRDDQDYITCAAELNGTAVAAGTHGILFIRSGADADWQPLVTRIQYPALRWNLAYGHNEFIRFNDSQMEASVDGSQWEPIANPPALSNATFGNGAWVGVKTNGTLTTAIDGRTWTDVQASVRAQTIHFGDSLFIADGAQTDVSQGLAVSRDGRNWRTIEFPISAMVRIIGNLNGRWAGIANNWIPVTSDDGENWTVHPRQSAFGSVYYFAAANDRFIGLEFGWDMGPGKVSWSFDGATWHEPQLLWALPAMPAKLLTSGGGKFLVLDGVGGVFYSSDGLNWQGGRQAPTPFLTAAYGGGRWLLTGFDSILRSVTGSQLPATLELVQSPTAIQIMLNGADEQTYEIHSAGSPTGPWNVVQRVSTQNSGHVVTDVQIDPSSASGFFRAIAVQP